jgi:hypothetical protein
MNEVKNENTIPAVPDEDSGLTTYGIRAKLERSK